MNPGQPPAIEFRNISISFDGVRALQNISFTLPRGEMLCITGDSDSGKSVLLRLALGCARRNCASRRFFSLTSRMMAVNNVCPPSSICEIEASIGNSSQSDRRP